MNHRIRVFSKKYYEFWKKKKNVQGINVKNMYSKFHKDRKEERTYNQGQKMTA